MLSCWHFAVGNRGWSSTERFYDCHSKKSILGYSPAIKDVPYAKIKDMNFQGKSSSWRQSRSEIKSVSPSPSPSPAPAPKKKRPNEYTANFDKFLGTLATYSSKPGILSLIPPYSDNFVPKSLASDFPSHLENLYNPDYLKLDYQSLLKKASEVTVEVTESQAKLWNNKPVVNTTPVYGTE